MGNKILEPERNESKGVESEGYKIITYPARNIPDDLKNLIIAPFLNSLRYGNDLFKLIDKDSYFFNYAKYIDLIINRPNTKASFAVLDDDTALGWSLFEDKTLHYVWVKKEVRRNGIARALVPKDINTISHITNKAINIWANKMPGVRFDPFA